MAEQSDTAEWRVVQGFPDYEVSSDGRVRRLTPHKKKAFGPGYMVRLRLNQDGYQTCVLWTGSQQKTVLVHRLVCEAFHGAPLFSGAVAAHWNGQRADNRPENLRWATCKENTADSIRHGTKPLGEKHPRAKVTAADVLAIRHLAKSLRDADIIGRRFGLSESNTKKIIHRVTWAHIP